MAACRICWMLMASIAVLVVDIRGEISAGPMLLRVVPRTESQVDFLHSLKNTRQGLKMQIWRFADEVERHVDIWVSPKTFGKFDRLMRDNGLAYEIVIKDLNRIDDLKDISMNNIEMFDDYYQRYDEIVGEIKRLAEVFKEQSTLIEIGTSHEKNTMYAIQIHLNKSEEKPIVFINCGVHSREWLAIASCKYVIRHVLFNHYYDHKVKGMLREFDIVVLPVMNPDGYKYSHDNRYRMWRKSRSPTSSYSCVGVDLNRNFNYRWGGGGSSPDPCDETYCGKKPFSEVEALYLARYLYKIRRRLVGFLDIHTFGQMWMSPWGYTQAMTKHYSSQLSVMRKIRSAIKREEGVTYKIGRSSRVLYETSGDSVDWVYGRLGVVHSYAIELRPAQTKRSVDGFKYTRKMIKPTGRDLLTGLLALTEALADETNAKVKKK